MKEKNTIIIGRISANDNLNKDIAICDEAKIVSRQHTRVFKEGTDVYVEDMNSTNGTYLNGERVFKKTKITENDTLYIGHFSFRLNEAYLNRNKEPAIEAIGLEKFYGIDKATSEAIGLHTINFKIPKQEFVAMMGPSGCGKSTLLKALNGDSPATAGKVKIHGLDLMKDYQYLKRKIGYVPQDDIVHKELEVEKSLYYAAKLRLGDDASEIFIANKIDEVLSNLNINRPDIRHKKIGELSGGQRKRVSIAVELLNSPTILFLDEPTSPLDPETIEEFLKCIKDLTKLGTTVIMVTHKPEDLNYVDKVILLTTKGYHAYYGDKGQILYDYFDTDNIISIYSLLSNESNIKELYGKWRGTNTEESTPQKPISKPKQVFKESALSQFYWLSVRYMNIKLNDRLNTLLLIIQPIIIASLVAFVFKDMHIGILFLMSITAIWFGVSNAAKEIVSEIPIFKRERMFNLRILTYLFSKITVLTIFSLVQVLMFIGIIYLRYLNDIPEGMDVSLMLGYYWKNVLFMLYLSFSATLMGLLLSSIFDNAEKVMTIVPIVLIPQIMLSGIIVKMEDPITEVFSYTTLGRWGTEGFSRIQDNYYYDTSTSKCSGSVTAAIYTLKTDSIINPQTNTTIISQIPTNKTKLIKKPAMDILDLYNDKLLKMFESNKINNTLIMISLINILTFIALYWAIRRKNIIN